MYESRKKTKEFHGPLNSSLPIFWNFPLDKGRLKSFVTWFLKNHGEKKTLALLEQLKNVGFGYATKAGISLGIEDLKIPPNKTELLAKSEVFVANSNLRYRKGDITGIEKMQQFIETWHETSETLKNEVVRYFEKTDILNPVYMMAFSGARGNLSQVRQLVGMRGLMADPQGKIIDFPIQSNFREGLTLTEYLISTYGARKGIVDTALRTATAGYLTRRLVDVAQHVIVSKFDCGTQRGIFLFDMKEGKKTIYSFSNRLTGRVLAQDIYSLPNTEKRLDNSPPNIQLAVRNQEITAELATAISKITKKALVRSPLTCETRKLVCQLCYGWSLATSRLVSIGEAVGVIGGQSIGEPGTQLTMRTFHTGGVFAGGITEQINAPFSGIVEYVEPISGTCIRTPQGFLAFLTKTNGTLFLKKVNKDGLDGNPLESKTPPFMNAYKIPSFTILFARHGEFIEQGKLLAQISEVPTGQKSTQTIEQTIYSSLEGEVYYNQLDLLEDIDEKYGERISKAEDWSKVWILSAKITKDPLVSDYLPNLRDFVKQNSVVNQIQWITNSSNFSYIQALPAKNPSQNLDYSYQLKNPYKPLSNLSKYENILTKYKSQFKLKPNQQTSFKSDSLLSEHSHGLKIFSLYHVQEKFAFNGVNFAYNKSKQQETISTKLKKIETFFEYPYQVNLRFHFIRLLSQTFISLPILRAGVLTTWLNASLVKYQKKKKENLNLLEPKGRHVFVRKLNMNKKYRIYQENKANYFHPLILSNYVPFSVVVNLKTIQNFFQRKTKLVNSDIENFRTYPYFNQHLLDFEQTKMFSKQMQLKNQTVDISLYKKCLEHMTRNFVRKNQKQYPKVQKFLVNPLNSYFKNSAAKNKKFLNTLVNKPKNLKMERLSIKSPILFFNTKNIRYQKLGYFVSASIQFKETDQFFSFLPLQEGSTDIQKRNVVEDFSNSFHFTKTLKENFQNKPPNYHPPINTVQLKNTDLWDSHSTQGFYWFPQFTQTLTNGISLISSPSLSQKIFHNRFVHHKVKNTKSTLLSTKKSIHLLNLAQSQIQKKQTTKKTLKKQEFSNNMKKMHGSKFVKHFNKLNQKKKFSYFMIPKNVRQHSFSLSFIQKKTVKYPFLKNIKHSQKAVLTLFKAQKPNSISQLDSKYLSIQKSAMLNTKKPPQKELQKFNETKAPSFSKKDFKNVQSLIMKLNYLQKSSVPFHEIYWLPQENYLVHTFLTKPSLKRYGLTQPGFFSYQSKTNCLNKNKETQYYLTNAQGFKKEMFFKYEGLLKLQKVRFLKLISKHQNLEKNTMDKNMKSLFLKEKTKPRLFGETFTMDLKNAHNLKLPKPNRIQKTASLNQSYFSHFKHLTKELKMKFLTYLLTKKNLEPELFPYGKKDKSLNSFHLKNSWVFTKKQQKSFFSFLPFLMLKNEVFKITPEKVKQLKNTVQKMDVQKRSALIKQKLNLSIKPGWVYRTKNVQNFFKMHKTWIEPGKSLLDDVCFEQQKVFLEPIPVTKDIQTNKHFFYLKNKDGNTLFNSSFTIQNKKSRFFKMETNSKVQSFNKAPSLFFLIRPATHTILPSLPQMKKALYKAMKKTEKSNFQASYFIYNQYFSNELNPQTKITKSLSSFAPMDIQLRWLNYFQSPSFSKKEKPVKIKTSKFKYKQKKVQKRIKKRWSSYLKESFYRNWFKTNSNFDTKEKIKKFVRKNRKSKRVFKKTSEKMYFSHYPMNFLQLKISVSLPKSSLLAYSFPQVSLNTSQTNTYSTNQIASPFNHALKNSYLTILMERNCHKFLPNQEKETFHVNKNPSQKNFSLNSPVSFSIFSQNSKPILKNKKIVYLKSLVSVSKCMPCFEYSFNQKYAFFANQKLFASSFYQQQYENFLKITTLENNLFLTETLNGKRFIKKSTNQNMVAESIRYSMNSKNQLIFINKYLNNKKPLGLTSFYSPYEGEVLKIYSISRSSTDLQNLKKSVNIFLDNGLFQERQREKLILTKSDIYGVDLPNSKEFPLLSKNPFPSLQTNPTLKVHKFEKNTFFNQNKSKNAFTHLHMYHQRFKQLEKAYYEQLNLNPYRISNMTTYYQNKRYKIKNVEFGLMQNRQKLRLGEFINPGDKFYSTTTFLHSGHIIHMNSKKFTLRKAEFFCVSPQAILHTYNGHCLTKNSAVMTLPFQTLKTGDIVQGIPKVEQYLEARTTIRGRLFLNSLPVLLHAIFQRYSSKLNMEKAVRQSFLKIQQILVDGVQRVYRSQGVSIADKHLEVIVRQMTSKVKIVYGGQTGFFPGELVDLEFVERINRFLMVKIRYEPVVLGITRASLEVDSFLSAASFQQTTKILTRSAMENKRDFLKGLKENLLVGNLLPAGTGYVVPLSEKNLF